MSKLRYFELYKKFINNTITVSEYKIFIHWVKQEENQFVVKEYMAELWETDLKDKDLQPKTWNEFLSQIDMPSNSPQVDQVNKKYFIPVMRWAAAILLLVVMVYGVSQLLFNDDKIYSTDFGETLTIDLDDGSKVILNANSTLVWDENWQRKGLRKAELIGEAYFDVQHMEGEVKFQVETEDLKVNVLGTTFNINNRRDETEVELKTGKIVLDLKSEEQAQLEMAPGDKIDFSVMKDKLVVTRNKTKAAEDLDWVNGVLNFEDVSVSDMFTEIEDLYGKKFLVVDKSLLERRMYTSIPFSDWPLVLQTIEISLGVKIEENNNELKIKKISKEE
ncbi:FecR family protein [Membranihabitans marinus]|uniref:FecR family protein n=1 Tax=Membranihabitans marinus TaxID=1227546 RepID=UPI001F3ED7C3|nr:FecR domain-containing protein [Membranihabitans marinus]